MSTDWAEVTLALHANEGKKTAWDRYVCRHIDNDPGDSSIAP